MADRMIPRFDLAACVACAACVEDCPVSCIALAAPAGRSARHHKPRLADEAACTGCGACARNCPVGAIAMAARAAARA